MSDWQPGDLIVCRFCSGTNCEHGDACKDCGCPRCGFPGARHEGRGFCLDCDWEAKPGARRVWRERQPVLTAHQMRRRVMEWLGAELPPDDEVGKPIFIVGEGND